MALLTALNTCLALGFANLTPAQHETLIRLANVFEGTSLPMQASVENWLGAIFQPQDFIRFASARAALQGAQYDGLRAELRELLECGEDLPLAENQITPSSPIPLLTSTQHWLADLAITGFNRLEKSLITHFMDTLRGLQADPALIRTSTMATGLMQEMLSQPAEIPLFRWSDLWTRTMLSTFTHQSPPMPELISGSFCPLGIAWYEQTQMVGCVVYGMVEDRFVRLTQSAFKVEAIQYPESWLFFPDMKLILESLQKGKTLVLEDMPILPSGDILWQADRATLGKKAYKLMEMAEEFFAPPKPSLLPPISPEQRHPLLISEPLLLKDCHLFTKNEFWFVKSGSWTFRLDAQRLAQTELDLTRIGGCARLFGLVYWDAGDWVFHILSAQHDKPIFIGRENSKLLTSAPKNNTLELLKERASRLLRVKS